MGANTNRSGLLIDEYGQLTVNANEQNGIYIDGVGQLKANIKRSATQEDLAGIGTADATPEAAITPANIGGAIKTINNQSIVGQGNITIETSSIATLDTVGIVKPLTGTYSGRRVNQSGLSLDSNGQLSVKVNKDFGL
jgi:hypothetical protein